MNTEDTATENFRRLLNSRMKAAGLTQAAIGKASGISQRGISKLQAGSASPTLRTLSCISDALNTPAALFVCSPEDARLFAAIGRLTTDQREALTLIAEQLASQPQPQHNPKESQHVDRMGI